MASANPHAMSPTVTTNGQAMPYCTKIAMARFPCRDGYRPPSLRSAVNGRVGRDPAARRDAGTAY